MTKKKENWQQIPSGDFAYWFGQWVLSSFALKFYHKHKRFPTAFLKESVRVRGRNISMELR